MLWCAKKSLKSLAILLLLFVSVQNFAFADTGEDKFPYNTKYLFMNQIPADTIKIVFKEDIFVPKGQTRVGISFRNINWGKERYGLNCYLRMASSSQSHRVIPEGSEYLVRRGDVSYPRIFLHHTEENAIDGIWCMAWYQDLDGSSNDRQFNSLYRGIKIKSFMELLSDILDFQVIE